MLKELKYGALAGKTRAMFGKLLKEKDYIALMQKKSVGEAVSYLKHETHYKDILADIDETDIHRRGLENLLRHDLVNDYSKLFKFTSGKMKQFIALLYLKVEIESLKLIFRVFEAGHAGEFDLEKALLFVSGSHQIDIPRLALSKDVEEFLNGLKGTVYYDLLRPFSSADNETRLFSMEMALDLFYLRSLQDSYQGLTSAGDREIVREIIGLECDIFNIFWIYRSKSFYNLDPEVIQSYTLPLIYKLGKEKMNLLLRANNLDEFADSLKGTYYEFLFEGRSQLSFEHSYSEFIYSVYKKKFRSEPFSIASAIAYIRMKEIELANITSIIEGIRYNLPEGKIRRFVVGINF